MNLISIQSHVAYGHVGNAAAVFPLQRLGFEVWPVHTVQFSNHTGYGAWRGRVFDGQAIDELVQGISERGALARCDGILSGYMGSADIGYAITRAVERVRAEQPHAAYCCDPVIGDVGRGVFVRPGIPEFMRDFAVPMANVITPNHFELDYLSNRTNASLAQVKESVTRVHTLGPEVILVTSLRVDETPDDAVDLLACCAGKFWLLRTPKLNLQVNGAGDAIAALFFAHYLKSKDVPLSLERAGSSIFGLLRQTEETRSRELQLVGAQEEFVSPSRHFTAEAI